MQQKLRKFLLHGGKLDITKTEFLGALPHPNFGVLATAEQVERSCLSSSNSGKEGDYNPEYLPPWIWSLTC